MRRSIRPHRRLMCDDAITERRIGDFCLWAHVARVAWPGATRCRHLSALVTGSDHSRHLAEQVATRNDISRRTPSARGTHQHSSTTSTRRIGDLCVTTEASVNQVTGEAPNSTESATYVGQHNLDAPNRRLMLGSTTSTRRIGDLCWAAQPRRAASATYVGQHNLDAPHRRLMLGSAVTKRRIGDFCMTSASEPRRPDLSGPRSRAPVRPPASARPDPSTAAPRGRG
ncbi:hypothetical protein BKA23_1766 [Rudaeicoccus suwonensis]|uniref:Uncharacterized protein n=1 Tax=Rudaeicoccus suwonensis TaxID=657409 RepID=A0A561EBG1_9MICO|nr:hypothetical protein BKA23_1766 [Rudaeicoccus suwonensis]